MIAVHNLVKRFGSQVAVDNLSFEIPAGQIVGFLGPNGAGKTTTLKTISGLLRPVSGTVLYQGRDITRLPPHQRVGLGLSQVPEGRMVFANLTVMENLKMGAYRFSAKAEIERDLENVFKLFPRLQERPGQLAGTLSGGEQQMLAIGRALMSRPQLLMLDEPSLGVAPLLVKNIFEKIVAINREQGITIVLVEQNANAALEISHYGYVLETGRILLADASAALRKNPQVRQAYLGVA